VPQSKRKKFLPTWRESVSDTVVRWTRGHAI